MTIWPVIVGVSAVGVTLLVFLRLKSASKMRLATAATRNLRGKIAVITGASSGLGREVAFELAKLQADVVLACRDRNKAQKAAELIENRLKQISTASSTSSDSTTASGGSHGKLHIMDLDLSDLCSVDAFAVEFGRRFENLHYLINNAGLMACPFSTSRGGSIELQFAVNHLGHFHLTNLLLPILRKSTPSRVLIVSSGYYRKLAHGLASTDVLDGSTFFDVVSKGKEPGYDALKAYARSKLANCLHGFELVKRISDSNVGVYVIRPGFVRGTELGRYFSGILTTLAKPFIWMFSQTVEQGAQTYLYCALTEESELKSGALYYNCAIQPYIENLVNERNAKSLWTLSDRLVKEEKESIERLEKEKEKATG